MIQNENFETIFQGELINTDKKVRENGTLQIMRHAHTLSITMVDVYMEGVHLILL